MNEVIRDLRHAVLIESLGCVFWTSVNILKVPWAQCGSDGGFACATDTGADGRPCATSHRIALQLVDVIVSHSHRRS